MSVFYNFTKFADNSQREDVRARFENFGGSRAVVENPSLYSVGVNRFKIPLNTIPLYRVYENELSLGLLMTGQGAYEGTTGVIKGKFNTNYARNSLFDGTNLYSKSHARYGIDSLNKNKKYLDIYSQEDFIKLLNRGISRALFSLFNSTGELQANGQIRNSNSGIPVQLGYGVNDDGITTIIQTGSGEIRPTLKKNNAGQIITGIRFKFNSFTRAAGVNNTLPIDFSQYDFYIRATPQTAPDIQVGSSAPTLFPLLIGKFKGLSEYVGDVLNMDREKVIEISTDHESHILASDCMDTKLYDDYNAQIPKVANNQTFKVYPDDLDGTGFIGHRFDGFNWDIVVKNKRTLNTSVNPPATSIAQVQFINLDISVANLTTIPNLALQQDVPYLNTIYDNLMPNFSLGADNRIRFNINTSYLLGFGIKMYFNNALDNILSFDEYKTTKFNSSNMNEFSLPTKTELDSDLEGVILDFPAEVYKNLNPLDKDAQRKLGDICEFPEARNTIFSRDWLNGIIITSGSLAVDGEILGDGDSRRKTITDFLIDPSSVGRDYLVFTDSGGMRFYPLLSTEPIRQIDVEILFQDIYGIIRPLLISTAQECALKLEFRPNNQLFNFEGSYNMLN